MVKDSLKQLLLLGTILALLGVSLSGVPEAKDFYVAKRVGKITIKPYKYGIYFTETHSQIFYNASPYQAYYFDGKGRKYPLLSFDKPVESVESDFKKRFLAPKLNAVLSYFNLLSPKATFILEDSKITYLSKSDGNKVSIKAVINNLDIRKLTMALSFNENDFVFDEERNVYSKKFDYEIEDFNYFFKENLKNYNEASESVSPKNPGSIYILNPETSMVIKISNNLNRGGIRVNPKEMVVEIDQLNLKKPKITVEVFDSLKEAKSAR